MSALDQISVFAVGYAGVVLLGALLVLVRRVPRPTWLDSMVWLLEVLMAIRAIAGVGKIVGGDRPAELAATVGYLLASVAIIPIALDSIDEDRGTWSTGVVAITALALGVIGVRLMMTT